MENYHSYEAYCSPTGGRNVIQKTVESRLEKMENDLETRELMDKWETAFNRIEQKLDVLELKARLQPRSPLNTQNMFHRGRGSRRRAFTRGARHRSIHNQHFSPHARQQNRSSDRQREGDVERDLTPSSPKEHTKQPEHPLWFQAIDRKLDCLTELVSRSVNSNTQGESTSNDMECQIIGQNQTGRARERGVTYEVRQSQETMLLSPGAATGRAVTFEERNRASILKSSEETAVGAFTAFTQTGSATLPLISLRVQDQVIPVLADTGSSLNLLSSSVLHLFHTYSTRACRTPILTISGHSTVLKSSVIAKIKLHTLHCEDLFYIFPGNLSPRFSMILGWPFLTKFGFSVNTREQTLANDVIRLRFIQQENDNEEIHAVQSQFIARPAFAARKYTIPPLSQVLIDLKTRQPFYSKTHSVLLNPVQTLLSRNLLVARTVCLAEGDGTLCIQVANFGDDTQHINKGTKLADIEEIHSVFGREHESYFMQQTDDIGPLHHTDLSWDASVDLEHLEAEQKRRVEGFLRDHADLFATDVTQLPGCDTLLHEIHLEDEQPVKLKPYRVPYNLREEMDAQLNLLLESQILVPSFSDYAAPVMLVKKNNGQYRLAVDFRKLNKKLVKDAFPIPNIGESIDALAGARYFSTLDLTSGFFQQFIAEEDQHKTAITTHRGLFQFTRSPFGLATSPNAFQRLMHVVLGDLSNLGIQIYIDDIAVASKDFDSHFEKLELVFTRLRQHNLRLKPSKCAFFKNHINFLGFEITGGEITPLNRNIDIISHFKIPRSRKDVRSFLGCLNYYRKFLPDFSARSWHLTALTKEKSKFQWSDEAQREFDDLRSALARPPCLALPDMEREFILFTDSSARALGAVLAQADPTGFPRPVAFASRKLNDAETRYSATERELLALVFAVTHFKCYVYHKKFIIYTDHAALTHFLKLKDPTSRIARWICTLSDFSFDTRHIKGKCNSVADFLSRGILHDTADTPVVNYIVEGANTDSLAFSPDDSFKQLIRTEQEADAKCLSIRQKVENNDIIKPTFMQFYIQNNLLCCKDTRNRNRRDRIPKLVLPLSLVPHIFQLTHDSPVACHPCFAKTLKRIQQYYYWPGMHAHIKNLVQSCDNCLQRRAHLSSGQAPLQRLPIPNRPMETVHLDVLGPLPQTYKGNRYIVAFVDAFSKWPEAFPVPSTTSDTIADVLAEFVARHGCPSVLVTDRGSNFMSEAIQQVYMNMGIKHVHTSAYHPAGNAKVERQHATMASALSHLANSRHTDWDEQLKFALLAMRSAVHRSTNESPFYVLTGRDMNLPYNAILTEPCLTYNENTSYCDELAANIRLTFLQVKEKLEEAAQEQEEYRAKFAKDKDIEVGDKVMMYSPAVPPNLSKKLHKQNTGPYRVLEQTSPVNFKISPLDNPLKTDVVHIDKLTKIPERCLFPALQVLQEQTVFQHEEAENIPETLNNDSSPELPAPQNETVHKNSRRHFSRVFHNTALLAANDTGCAPPSHDYNLRPRR